MLLKRAKNNFGNSFEVVFISMLGKIVTAVGLVGKVRKSDNQLKPELLVSASVVQVHCPPQSKGLGSARAF